MERRDAPGTTRPIMTNDVTQLLVDWSNGDEGALRELLPLVYDELHRLAETYMRRERPGHTLQPTALVHEAYLRLVDQTRVRWRNRAHFIGVAAQLMRRVAVKHAERHRAAKRGGGALRMPFDEAALPGTASEEDVIALDEALERLKQLDPRQSRIVELRFFGGLTGKEMTAVLGVSQATLDREWRAARAWLRRELAAGR
jgi:RNA polymerase sigma factor (TIGR02999 family)